MTLSVSGEPVAQAGVAFPLHDDGLSLHGTVLSQVLVHVSTNKTNLNQPPDCLGFVGLGSPKDPRPRARMSGRVLCGGFGRVMAARQLGLSAVPTIRLSYHKHAESQTLAILAEPTGATCQLLEIRNRHPDIAKGTAAAPL